MRRISILLISALCTLPTAAQELFTFSEPASNMPQKSFALRANNFAMRSVSDGAYRYSFAPEVMVGISAKWMAHAEAFFGNDAGKFGFDGASLYAKYRFYSADEVHSHFRMAATAKIAASNLPVSQPAVDLGSRNSGAELGFVATQLIHRTALSAGVSHVSVFDKKQASYAPRNAVNFNLSFGTLVLPREYRDYDQVNVNLMAEFPGQYLPGTGKSYLDFAPSVQFIFKSKIRVDAGYRLPIVKDLHRFADRSFLLRAEYNFFSVFR